jgi:hypothetical protein
VSKSPSRTATYRETLRPLIRKACERSDYDALSAFLVANSNLPGPRGNLELAEAFADAAVQECAPIPEALWNLCSELLRYSADVAPANNAKEFLPFCAICGLGALAAASANRFTKVTNVLQQSAKDQRWRIREAVAWALQRMLASHPQRTLQTLEAWIASGDCLVLRAVAAAVAEPSLLHDAETAQRALEIHRKVLAQVIAATERHTQEFRTLRQGLSYSLSVVVQASPREGFEYLQELVSSRDPDILQIVKANLAKKRLSSNFPNEVAAMARGLSQ